MNKNQKRVPYTYTGLILGNRFSAAYHRHMIGKLEAQRRKLASKGKDTLEVREAIQYNQEQLEYFNEEYARLSLTRLVCGDGTVLIR